MPFRIQLALVAGFGFLLRLYRLDWQSAWLDELFTMQVASMDFGQMMQEMVWDFAHPPLHMLAARGVMELIGFGLWQVRLLSAICGALEIFVVGLLATKLFEQQVGILSALLMAVAQAKIYESQEARGYALAALLGMLASYWFFSALTEGRGSDWWKFVGAIGLMLNTHYYTVFVLLALVVFALLFRRDYVVPWIWWAGAGLATCCLMLPWLCSGVVGEVLRRWHPSSFPSMNRASASTLLMVLNWFNNGKWNGATVVSPLWTFPVGVLLFTLPAIWGLFQIRHGSMERQRLSFVALLWLVPMLVICLGSWASGIIFESRYVVLALAPYLVLVAVGLDRMRGQFRRVLLAVMLSYSLVVLRANYFVETKADYKGVVRYLTSIEGEGVCLAWWNMQSSVDMGAAAWSVYSGRPMLQRVHLNRGAVAGSGCETVALVQDSFSMTPVTKQELEELSDLYPKQSVLRFRGASVYVLRPRLDKN